MTVQINEKRLLETFLNLVRIDSETFHEGAIQKYLAEELKKAGAQVYIDKVGKKIGSDAQGNMIATVKGTGKKTFLLGAHMDTVSPGQGVKPIVKKDRVTSDGTTILGADDKAGLAIILEVLTALKESKVPHASLQAIFTLAEEQGMGGSKNLDYSKLKGREGLLLDNESVQDLLIKGPSVCTVIVGIKGVSAHAGVCPEKGISAVEVAAKALSMMKLGRIDKETVANFGVVSGGQVTNAVMPALSLRGEARSLDPKKLQKQLKHMQECFEKAAKLFAKRVDGKIIKPEIDFQVIKRYDALQIPKTHPVVKQTVAAGRKLGVTVRPMACGGGCDANVLAAHGIIMPNLGVGVEKCHTTEEYLNLKEFYQAACIVLETVLNYK